MSYYKAVGATGTTNATIIRSYLKSMPEMETFAFPLQYFNNGTNMFPQIYPLQFVNGVGRIVTTENLLYPAPWRTAGTHFFLRLLLHR